MPTIPRFGGGAGEVSFEYGISSLTYSGSTRYFNINTTKKAKILHFANQIRSASSNYGVGCLIIDFENNFYKVFGGYGGTNSSNDFVQDLTSYFTVTWTRTDTTLSVTITTSDSNRAFGLGMATHYYIRT